MSEENDGPKGPKRSTLPWSEVDAMAAGIERYEKASFWVIGHRGGTRLAIPKTTTGVSRAYFYGTYEQVPVAPAIRTFTPEERKRLHRGGIVAEVDFDGGVEGATAAMAALIAVIRVAPAPAPMGERKPRPPRAAKAKPPAAGDPE